MQGTWQGADQTEYSGEWKGACSLSLVVLVPVEHILISSPADRWHGKGKLVYYLGTYVGSFVDGKKEGEGEMLYSNGSRYVGQWKVNASLRVHPHSLECKTELTVS